MYKGKFSSFICTSVYHNYSGSCVKAYNIFLLKRQHRKVLKCTREITTACCRLCALSRSPTPTGNHTENQTKQRYQLLEIPKWELYPIPQVQFRAIKMLLVKSALLWSIMYPLSVTRMYKYSFPELCAQGSASGLQFFISI